MRGNCRELSRRNQILVVQAEQQVSRLRRIIRFADDPAPLEMTVFGGGWLNAFGFAVRQRKSSARNLG
jgi:hypothetical protein